MRPFSIPALAAAALALASPMATAQVYPSQAQTPVTDDADLLGPVQEAELAARIVALEQSTGSDIAVVTLPGAQFYTMGEDLAVYAAGLVANWGLGDTTGGRSVLLLVLRHDRELHLGLGTGFTDAQTALTGPIVTEVILPALRNDDYPAALSGGIEAVATRILAAAPPDTADDIPTGIAPAGESRVLWWLAGGGLVLVGLILRANRRARARLAATPCPSCAKTGLIRERTTLAPATETAEGRGEVRISCPACGHAKTEPFSIPRLDNQASGPKGKGSGTTAEW